MNSFKSAKPDIKQNGKEQKKKCTVFEPQTWRRTMCKNCFKTKEQHTAADSQPTVTSLEPNSDDAPANTNSLDVVTNLATDANLTSPMIVKELKTAQLDKANSKSFSNSENSFEKENLLSDTNKPNSGINEHQINAVLTDNVISLTNADAKTMSKAVGSVKPTVVTPSSAVQESRSNANTLITNVVDQNGCGSGKENRAENVVVDSDQIVNAISNIPSQINHKSELLPDADQASSLDKSASNSSLTQSASVNPPENKLDCVSNVSSELDQSQVPSRADSEARNVTNGDDKEEESYYSRVIAEARKMLEEEERQQSSSKQRPLVAAIPASRPATPRQPPIQAVQPRSKDDSSTPSIRSKDDNDIMQNSRRIRNARRGSRQEESEWRRAERVRNNDLSRDEAMMEGTRMLIDNLKDKVTQLEDKCIRLDKEKGALNDLLAIRKKEYESLEDEWNSKVIELENEIRRLINDKNRLINQIGVPEKDRSVVQRQEIELTALHRKIEEMVNQYVDLEDENAELKKEIGDLQLEMDEMHDHYRDEEAIAFRELQRDLDVASKNCRILQFQLKKIERRNEQLELEIKDFEQKMRSDAKSTNSTDSATVKKLEEELKQKIIDLTCLQTAVKSAESEKQSFVCEIDNVKKQLKKCESERASVLQQLESVQQELSLSTEKLKQTDTITQQLQDKIKALEESKSKEKDERKKLKEQAWKQEKLDLEAQVVSLTQKLQESQQTETKKSSKSSKKTFSEKEIVKKEADDDLKNLKELCDSLAKEVENWKLKYNETLGKSEKSEMLSEKDNKIKELNDLLQQKDATLKENKATLKSKKSELKEMKKQNEQLDSELKKVKLSVEQLEQNIKATDGQDSTQLKQIQEQLTLKLEEISKLNKQIAEKEQMFKKLEEQHQQHLEKLNVANEDKLHLQQKLKDIDTQLNEAKKQLSVKQKNFEESEGKFKAELQSVKTDLEIKIAKLKENEKKIKDLAKELDDTKLIAKEKDKLQTEKTKLENELKQLKEKNATPSKVSALAAKAEQAKDKDKEAKDKETLAKERENITKDKENLKKEKENLKIEQESLKTQKEMLQKQQEMFTQEKSLLSQEKDKVVKERDNLNKELENVKKSSLTAKANVKEKDLTSSKEKETLAKEKETFAKEKELFNKDKANLLKEKGQLVKETENLAKQLEAVKKEKDSLATQLDNITKERDCINKEKENFMVEKQQVVKDKDLLAKEKEEMLKERENLKKEKSQLAKEKETSKLKEKETEKTKQVNNGKDKKVLEDQIINLKKEMEEKSKEWNAQKVNFEKVIHENAKLIAEKNAADEAEGLKNQTLNGQKVTPIPVIHEKSSGSEQEKEITALRFKIEQLEKQWLDEKRILEEQNKKQNGSLADCNKQIAVMKKENSDQSVLLSSSRNMLTEIKAKFDSSLSSWTTEKELLQKNIKQLEEKAQKLTSAEKQLDELRAHLREEETKRLQLEVQLTGEKINIPSSAAKNSSPLETKVAPDTKLSTSNNKLSLATTKAKVVTSTQNIAGKANSLKNKFEKPDPKDKKLISSLVDVKNSDLPPSETASSKENSVNTVSTTVADVTSNSEENGKLLLQIQQSLKSLQNTREEEMKQVSERLKMKTEEWEKERSLLLGKISLLEKQCVEMNGAQKMAVELQCALQEGKENWHREKTELERLVEETRKQNSNIDVANSLFDQATKTNAVTSNGTPLSSPKIMKIQNVTPILVSHTSKQGSVVKSPTSPQSPIGNVTSTEASSAASSDGGVTSFVIKQPGRTMHIKIDRQLRPNVTGSKK